MKKKNRRNTRDNFDALIEGMIKNYVAETGDNDWTRGKVADWAVAKGLYVQKMPSAAKELAKVIGRVAGKATFTDEEGNSVRKYHSWQSGPGQPTFWSAMDVISLERMAYSLNSRRDKLVDGAVRVIIDAEYYNKHHNPGDPINIVTDLTKDVKEKRQPGLYDDVPPDDEEAGN